jgi:hypothetical protein
MGLFGSKKKDAGKPGSAATGRKPVTEAPQSTRKSVRRVVPKGAGTGSTGRVTQRHAPPPKTAAAASAAAEPIIDDVQLPPAALESDQLDLGVEAQPAMAEPTPRQSGTSPILASNAPDFGGSLDAVRNGPSRSGDAVLIEFLTGKSGLLTSEQAEAVRVKAEAEALPLDDAAVRLGVLTEEQLVNSLSQETWVPHLKVDKYEIRKKALDTIARDDAQHFGVFPVDKLGNLLTLAMVNPLDAEAIRQLEAKTGLDIKKVVATRSEIASAIDKYYGGKVLASDGSRSFSQEVSDSPKSATQMLSRGLDEPLVSPAATPAFDLTPPRPSHVIQDISADIQDIDDLLGGDETIAPAILEPVSIKPEESNDALELTDAPITQSIHAADSELEFGLQDAPKKDTGALARSALDLEKTDEIVLPTIPSTSAPAPVARPSRAGRSGEVRSATARITAGNAGSRVVNLVPVLEEEFRYAISHGKSKVFERWVALQSRNRIVNAVAVEKELEPILAGLYAVPRKVG